MEILSLWTPPPAHNDIFHPVEDVFQQYPSGHQLKPGYHGTVIFHFKCSMDHQVPVDSDTDDQIILSRLHMNVTGIL